MDLPPDPAAVPEELRAEALALGLGEPVRCVRTACTTPGFAGPCLVALYETELVLAYPDRTLRLGFDRVIGASAPRDSGVEYQGDSDLTFSPPRHGFEVRWRDTPDSAPSTLHVALEPMEAWATDLWTVRKRFATRRARRTPTR